MNSQRENIYYSGGITELPLYLLLRQFPTFNIQRTTTKTQQSTNQDVVNKMQNFIPATILAGESRDHAAVQQAGEACWAQILLKANAIGRTEFLKGLSDTFRAAGVPREKAYHAAVGFFFWVMEQPDADGTEQSAEADWAQFSHKANAIGMYAFIGGLCDGFTAAELPQSKALDATADFFTWVVQQPDPEGESTT